MTAGAVFPHPKFQSVGGLLCFEKEEGWDGAMTTQTNDCSQGEAWKMSERVGFRMTGACKNVGKGNIIPYFHNLHKISQCKDHSLR